MLLVTDFPECFVAPPRIPHLNYKRYLMLTVEKGRITKREFQDRKLWDQ